MGRHAADDGASAHPLVAEALQRSGHGGRRHGDEMGQEQGGLGWPGPSSPGGGGIGWPADDSADEPAPAVRRRGRRRLFGRRAA